MSGNARGPSTAFNLVYRLCQLHPTAKQIRVLLDHKDSPYIRAVSGHGHMPQDGRNGLALRCGGWTAGPALYARTERMQRAQVL